MITSSPTKVTYIDTKSSSNKKNNSDILHNARKISKEHLSDAINNHSEIKSLFTDSNPNPNQLIALANCINMMTVIGLSSHSVSSSGPKQEEIAVELKNGLGIYERRFY